MNNIQDVLVIEDASITNTYNLKVKAKYLIKVKSIKGLQEVLKYLEEKKIDYFILGAGSNVILDEYFNGAIIKLELDNIKIEDQMVIAEAGCMMGKLSFKTVAKSLKGLEWAANIPGTVGGSIVGNAGAYNSEIFDNLVSIKILNENLEIEELSKDKIEHSYRYTSLKSRKIIVLEATFLLEKGNKEELENIMKDRCERRRDTQPLDMPSAGSVFRNPEGDYAGRLIEEAGLKGYAIGGAKVSEKHANFIVNTGGASSNYIKNLIRLIQRVVKEKFKIDLILEQELVEWKN